MNKRKGQSKEEREKEIFDRLAHFPLVQWLVLSRGAWNFILTSAVSDRVQHRCTAFCSFCRHISRKLYWKKSGQALKPCSRGHVPAFKALVYLILPQYRLCSAYPLQHSDLQFHIYHLKHTLDGPCGWITFVELFVSRQTPFPFLALVNSAMTTHRLTFTWIYTPSWFSWSDNICNFSFLRTFHAFSYNGYTNNVFPPRFLYFVHLIIIWCGMWCVSFQFFVFFF